MIQDADKGSLVTTRDDVRITQIGQIIRRFRLDEISQLILINVLKGGMTFVGERDIIEATKKNIDFSRVVAVNSVSL